MTKRNWSEDFFDNDFGAAFLGSEGAAAAARQASDFIIRTAKLKKGSMIFDQCCGIGNVSFCLAERGMNTIGIDVIPAYITQARRQTEERNLACRFIEGDARDFITPEPCDAAFNWWTSFGYFEEDEENLKMLLCAYKSLKKGGIFILDGMNRDERLSNLEGGQVALHASAEGVWKTRYDAARNMIFRSWTYEKTGGGIIEKKGGGVKLYSAKDITLLLKEAGFRDIAFYGSASGEVLTMESPRCIAVAQK